MRDQDEVKSLVLEIQKGEEAEFIKFYLDKWLQEKREEIIGIIRVCPVDDLVSVRAMLQAVDLLVAQINADIANGKLASKELDEGGVIYG